MQAKLPPACARSVEAVSPLDAGEASGGTRSRQAAVPRLTCAFGRCQHIRGVPRPAQQEALVRLRQAPVRGPKGRARLSRYTHRVAISNSRLIAVDQRSVTFKVK